MLTEKSQRSQRSNSGFQVQMRKILFLFPAFCFPAESDCETAPPVDRVPLFFVETLSAAEAADAANRFWNVSSLLCVRLLLLLFLLPLLLSSWKTKVHNLQGSPASGHKPSFDLLRLQHCSLFTAFTHKKWMWRRKVRETSELICEHRALIFMSPPQFENWSCTL